MDIAEKLAQALRRALKWTSCPDAPVYNIRREYEYDMVFAREALKAHESRAQPDVNEGCQRVMRARGKPYPRTCKVCDWHGPCVVSDAQLAALEGQPPAKDERE